MARGTGLKCPYLGSEPSSVRTTDGGCPYVLRPWRDAWRTCFLPRRPQRLLPSRCPAQVQPRARAAASNPVPSSVWEVLVTSVQYPATGIAYERVARETLSYRTREPISSARPPQSRGRRLLILESECAIHFLRRKPVSTRWAAA